MNREVYKEYALRIPAEIREEIVELRLIRKAIPVVQSVEMLELYKIYKQHVSSYGLVDDCPACLQTVLANYRKMRPELVKLVHDQRKLKAL